ncbi:MAG: hypothetical protein IJC46_08270 [Clostridia bacterium]|nr:hypothetical protein [Clostridia bacterium]
MKKKTPYVPQFADEIAGKTIEKSPLKNHIGTSVVFNQKQPLIQEESKPDFDLYIKWRNKKA